MTKNWKKYIAKNYFYLFDQTLQFFIKTLNL